MTDSEPKGQIVVAKGWVKAPITILVYIILPLLWFTVGSFIYYTGIEAEGYATFGAGFFVACVWLGFYIYVGFRLVEQRGFAVIECMDQYLRTELGGPFVLRWPFDHVRERGSLVGVDIPIFEGESLDFKDGVTAPVNAKLWFSVASVEDIRTKNTAGITRSILEFVYSFNNAKQRAIGVLEARLRPELQKLTIEQADEEKGVIGRKVLDESMPSLLAAGLHPVSGDDALVVKDIVLPPSVIAIREDIIRKMAEGEGERNKSEILQEAIGKLMNAEGAQKMSLEQARDFVLQLEGFDVLRNSDANMSFVAKDLGGVMGTINLKTGT